jgi:hypothetical protein
MGFLSINGAALSSLQTWVVIVIGAGTLGISTFRENKAVTSNEAVERAVIEQGIEIEHLKEGQDIIKENAIAHEEDFDAIMGELSILKSAQEDSEERISEIINIGQFYIKNQEKLNDEQMRDVVNDMLKKNGWSPWLAPIAYEHTTKEEKAK